MKVTGDLDHWVSTSQWSGGATCGDKHWWKRNFIISRNSTVGRREEVVFWLELRGRGGCISLADARVCLYVVSNPAKRAYTGGWGVVKKWVKPTSGQVLALERVKALYRFIGPWSESRSRYGCEAQWVLRSLGKREVVKQKECWVPTWYQWSLTCDHLCPSPAQQVFGAGMGQVGVGTTGRCYSCTRQGGRGEQGVQALGLEIPYLECCFCHQWLYKQLVTYSSNFFESQLWPFFSPLTGFLFFLFLLANNTLELAVTTFARSPAFIPTSNAFIVTCSVQLPTCSQDSSIVKPYHHLKAQTLLVDPLHNELKWYSAAK